MFVTAWTKPEPFGVAKARTLRRSRGSAARVTRSNSSSRSSARVMAGLATFNLAANPRTVCSSFWSKEQTSNTASWRAVRSGAS